MAVIIASIVLEILKILGNAFLAYYSPEEMKARREAKAAANSGEAKKEIKDAIVDYHLNSLASAINERIRDRLRKPDENPQRWRTGFFATGLKVPTEDLSGDGKKQES